jgi:SAM-dependent methyltransferase
MATALVAAVPGVPVAAGLAEALPLATASVDLLTVAQGFHWFDGPRAFAECRRVLRPGGHLALIWNERDESVPWVKSFTDIIDEHGGARPYTRHQDWPALTAAAGFLDVTSHTFSNPVVTDRAGVVERAASTSYVAALPDDRREVALAAIAELVEPMDEPINYPHTTDLTLARR